MVLKMALYLKFKARHFGTRLFWYRFGCPSLAAPKGVSKRMVSKMSRFLNFEKLSFWYPFVLVPVWVPPSHELAEDP